MTFNNFNKADLAKIAKKIKEEIYQVTNTYKITTFLCGADISDTSTFRFKFANLLRSHWYLIDLIYPEDIFEELLYSSKRRDLLSLENLLAESVDAIVLIPESAGSFAELGAFANVPNLRKKTICLIDKKYKKKRSFINKGPVELIKKEDKNNIIYFDTKNIQRDFERLRKQLRKIKDISSKKTEEISLLQIDNFLLPAIYLLEPIDKDSLVNLVSVATGDESNSFQVTTASLTIMNKKKLIEMVDSKYRLSKSGEREFFNQRQTSTRIKIQRETNNLDAIRLEILNLRNRRKKLSI